MRTSTARRGGRAALACCLLVLLASSVPVLSQEEQQKPAGAGAAAVGAKKTPTPTVVSTKAAGEKQPKAAAATAVPDPAAIHTPDYSIYRSASDVRARVAAIVAAHPDTMRLDEVVEVGEPDGSTSEKRTYAANLTVVTVALGGLPVAVRDSAPDPASPPAANVSSVIAAADPPGAWDESYRLLLSFGEHGRELITVEAGLALLELLALGADAAAAAAVAGGGGVNQPRRAGPKTAATTTTLAAALKRSVFKIIPMENAGGRGRVEAGALCERKNGRGVDPNRNWALDWGGKEPDYDPSEEFPGAAPFSEPEPSVLRALATAFLPHAWVNAHSGMEALFMPYDHVASVPEGRGPAATLALLRSLNGPACGGRCAVGSGGAAVGYLAHGTATDWMWGALGVPVSSTWEIYGDEGAPPDDCFRMFNPIVGGRPAVDEVAGRWARAVLLLAGHLPAHPDVKLGAAARRERAAAAAAAAAALDADAAVRVAAGVAAEEMDGGGGEDDKADAEPASPIQEQEKPKQPGPRPPPSDEDAAATTPEEEAALAARAAEAEVVAAEAAAAFQRAGAPPVAPASGTRWSPAIAVAGAVLAGVAVLAWRRRRSGGGDSGGLSAGGLPVAGAAMPASSPPRRLAP